MKPKYFEYKLNPTTLIQLSGGIDSVYIVWKYLKENPNEVFLIHHINLINNEGRWEKEKEAVDNVLNWLNENELTNYYYLENTFDYGDLHYIINDVEICGFHIGMILRNPRWSSLKRVIMPIYNKESDRELRKSELIKLVGYNNLIDIEYPLYSKTKEDVIREIPKELLDMCWYCRRPSALTKVIKPCGFCHTCQEVKEALNKI